jgi:hypothetical protein
MCKLFKIINLKLQILELLPEVSYKSNRISLLELKKASGALHGASFNSRKTQLMSVLVRKTCCGVFRYFCFSFLRV